MVFKLMPDLSAVRLVDSKLEDVAPQDLTGSCTPGNLFRNRVCSLVYEFPSEEILDRNRGLQQSSLTFTEVWEEA